MLTEFLVGIERFGPCQRLGFTAPASLLISTLGQLTSIALASPRSGTSHRHW
jgi:hypothetical protein